MQDYVVRRSNRLTMTYDEKGKCFLIHCLGKYQPWQVEDDMGAVIDQANRWDLTAPEFRDLVCWSYGIDDLEEQIQYSLDKGWGVHG